MDPMHQPLGQGHSEQQLGEGRELSRLETARQIGFVLGRYGHDPVEQHEFGGYLVTLRERCVHAAFGAAINSQVY